jgi:CelD/BcsL family acetyltransferase involved in cellulose biosynthesis
MLEKPSPMNTAHVTLRGAGSLEISLFEDILAVEEDWKWLQTHGICSLYQRFEWVKAWTQNVAGSISMQPRIVVGKCGGKPMFILPLGLSKKGPVKFVTWLGDSHSNFYMGLFDQSFIENSDEQDVRDMMACSLATMGRVDVLALGSQPLTWLGFDNPLALLKRQVSHNHAFALDLNDGFEAAVNKNNGSRKQKKYKRQQKLLSDVGGATLRIASSEVEIDALLDTSFAQMAGRFRQAGIWNRFEDEGVAHFVRQVAKSALGESEPQLLIYGLEIDGKIRATFAGGIHKGQFSGCFISLADDEYLNISPGELIIYLVVQDCVERGLICFDLGRGEEHYKSSWCDTTLAMFESHQALSLLGIAPVAYKRGQIAIKRRIRENEALWTMTKRIRARLYGRN